MMSKRHHVIYARAQTPVEAEEAERLKFKLWELRGRLHCPNSFQLVKKLAEIAEQYLDGEN